jgi:cyclic beta-1,2-glucan synthetase
MALAQVLLLAISLVRTGRHPSFLGQASLLAVPFAFNWLLLLQAPHLLVEMTAALPPGGILGQRGLELAGRVLVLAAFNVATALALNALCIGRILREPGTFALLAGSALLAGLSPLAADLGASPAAAALPAGLGILAAIASVALAQAGLWSQTFLMTGLLMDALKGRRPARYWGDQAFPGRAGERGRVQRAVPGPALPGPGPGGLHAAAGRAPDRPAADPPGGGRGLHAPGQDHPRNL